MSIAGDIWGLFLSIALILGGLSGQFVLRGTSSSQGLVIVGVLYLMYDLYRLATFKSRKEKAERERMDAAGKREKRAKEIDRSTERLPSPKTLSLQTLTHLKTGDYAVMLNGEAVGLLNSKRPLTITTDKRLNTLRVSRTDDARAVFPPTCFEVTESMDAKATLYPAMAIPFSFAGSQKKNGCKLLA